MDALTAFLAVLSALIVPIVYVLAQPPQVPFNMGVAVVSGLVTFAAVSVLGTLIVACFPSRPSG